MAINASKWWKIVIGIQRSTDPQSTVFWDEFLTQPATTSGLQKSETLGVYKMSW